MSIEQPTSSSRLNESQTPRVELTHSLPISARELLGRTVEDYNYLRLATSSIHLLTGKNKETGTTTYTAFFDHEPLGGQALFDLLVAIAPVPDLAPEIKHVIADLRPMYQGEVVVDYKPFQNTLNYDDTLQNQGLRSDHMKFLQPAWDDFMAHAGEFTDALTVDTESLRHWLFDVGQYWVHLANYVGGRKQNDAFDKSIAALKESGFEQFSFDGVQLTLNFRNRLKIICPVTKEKTLSPFHRIAEISDFDSTLTLLPTLQWTVSDGVRQIQSDRLLDGNTSHIGMQFLRPSKMVRELSNSTSRLSLPIGLATLAYLMPDVRDRTHWLSEEALSGDLRPKGPAQVMIDVYRSREEFAYHPLLEALENHAKHKPTLVDRVRSEINMARRQLTQ